MADAHVEGTSLRGLSAEFPTVVGETLEIGDIVLMPVVFEFEEEIGDGLNQSDDTFDFAAFAGDFTFPFFGTDHTGVFIGSNGYLTFGAGDTDTSESVNDFLAPEPRIAAFFDDLNPGAGGDVFVNQFPGRFVVTYQGVPEFSNTGSNTFQVTLFTDGAIQFAYRDLTAADAIVGVSPGGSPAPPFVQVDYSQDSPVSTDGPVAILELFSAFDLEEAFLSFTPNATGGFDVTTFTPGRTTVQGVVRDAGGLAVEEARVTIVGSAFTGLVAMTDMDGFFSIPDVPATRGNIQARAVKITTANELLFGTSVSVFPVPLAITDVGVITVTETDLPAGGVFEPEIGTSLNQGDDVVDQVSLPFAFPFYGTDHTDVFVGSNGYLTFGSGDTDFTESVNDFLAPQPRIAPFFDDLDPEAGGGVFVNDQLPGRFVVTYQGVPEFSPGGSNTIQATLFADGRIQFVYNGLTASDAIVGLSPGGSPAPPFVQVDYSEDVVSSADGQTAIFEQFFGSTNNPFDLDGGSVIYAPNATGGYDTTTIPPLPCVGQGTVGGYVLGDDGSPYIGVKVLVTCSCDLQYGDTVLTDDTGHFSLSGVPAGGGINVEAFGSDGTVIAVGGDILAVDGQSLTINPVPPSAETKP